MKDTSDTMELVYHRMLMELSGVERLAMGCRMFDSARAIVRTSLGDPSGTNSSPEMKAQLFLRIYGPDYDPATRDRIAQRLRGLGQS